MKFRIVTFNRAYNYGAVLQNYALAKCFIDNGANCETLDYSPKVFRNVYNLHVPIKLRRSCLKNIVKRLMVNKVIKERNKRFSSFISKYIKCSDIKYTTYEQIKEMTSDCDCYITGSDQVWHYKWTNFDPVYFLDFPDAVNKIRCSYAASFGMKKIPKEYITEYKKRLKGYKSYSVREESGVNIVKELTGEKGEVSCDPTLLLSSKEWENVCCTSMREESYIFVYYTFESKMLFEAAKQVSKQTGLKVICLPCNMTFGPLMGKSEKLYGFESCPYLGPEDFLSYIKNAQYVLTNSFHGTVFSIIFHKKFMAQLVTDKGEKNSRIDELFEILGIKNRDIETNLNTIDQPMEWDNIDCAIDKIRKQSTDYINRIIKGEF